MLQKSPEENISKEMQSEIVDQQKTKRHIFRILSYQWENFVYRMAPCSNWVKQEPSFTTEAYIHQGLKYYFAKSIISYITNHFYEAEVRCQFHLLNNSTF